MRLENRRLAESLVIAFMLSGCDYKVSSSHDTDASGTGGRLRLVLSADTAPIGSEVAIGLRSADSAAILAIQGTLYFDPERLRYSGVSNDSAVLIAAYNTSQAGRGQVQLALGAAASGMRAAIVFTVKRPNYASGLFFETKTGVFQDGASLAGQIARPGEIDPLLPARANAPPAIAVLPRRSAGLIPPNTQYGDANLDGRLNVGDALLVANIGVGNLVTPGPGDPVEVAANLTPVNGPGRGGVDDSLPPGWESNCVRRLDVLDALVIAQAVVGRPTGIAGTDVPSDALEFPSHRLRGGICGSGVLPLTDLGTTRYLGTWQGGLYPGGSNTMPAAHAAAGAIRARRVKPRDVTGAASPGGKIILLSVGMSNVTQEWCAAVSTAPCEPWSFASRAAADPAVNHTSLVIANGARGGETAFSWDSPADPMYDWVRDSILAPRQLSEQQVQVVWLKESLSTPQVSLPSPSADAFAMEIALGNIMRALKARYPHLQMVLLSSRVYAGFAATPLNPEPFAYESGFSVKWLIEAQINQMLNGGTVSDPRAGDLDYSSGAPWIAWGPYLWADGYRRRADGVRWLPTDFESDGTHPSAAGESTVAGKLLAFFKTDARTACWFVAGRVCP